ncbi:16S rRNA (cytosine(967)-C(5))-methyltransferase RsmB [Anaerosalibacter sp. Marseille-P3206]|uniref:16S rRNA (cytosine(967)-C(5))-methyltransferase RsmB n=1 Tax=Anaerosalibacter sp. Marseille-P3206 TaxID=1871005 RepID=UPI000986C903|nr:16S rRNA (cytosine(967)-C(5))-methyltransferase RsmB [Anaerosalibacter sp. Marseille-P3206]
MSIGARDTALKILMEVNQDGAYSNIAIKRNLKGELGKLDESLVREIVYGVLENRLYLDYIIGKFSKIKLNKMEPVILEILRIGIYQIRFMEKIPDRAAVNESVKLARKHSNPGSVKFVNGILRNISRKKESIIDIDEKNKIDYLSIKYSHPKWLVKRWIGEYGEEFTEKLCIENNNKPKLNIRVNTTKTTRVELKSILESNGFVVSETKYSLDGLIVDNPYRITDMKEYLEGLFTIQDQSSMLVAQIMNPSKGSFVIDLCSAPGGKTTHISEKMNNDGRILARDIYEHKLKLVKENYERLGSTIIKTEVFDATVFDENLVESADYVLIDAPCTGLGMIRRRPEIKWNRVEKDIKSITEIQKTILKNGSRYLKPGGVLVYSTCTIEKDENINLITGFVKENKNFEFCGFDHLLSSNYSMNTSKDGYIELYPHIHQMDGFFIAKLTKKNR